MATSQFPGNPLTVQTATAGALTGDGTSGSKLAVAVDGSSVDINGSNQLEVKGGAVPGSDTQVIFNDGGVFGASSKFIFDKTTRLKVAFGDEQLWVNTDSIYLQDIGGSILLYSDTQLTLSSDGDATLGAGGILTVDTPAPWFTATAGLYFPNEIGTPGAGTTHLVRLGTPNDIFLSLVDGQPGTNDATQGRQLVTYARPATALLPLSGVSNFLGGFFWDGVSSKPRSIELENKISATGVAQLWLEEGTETGGHPFMRFYRSGTDNGNIASHTNAGDTLNLQAYDVDGTAYKTFATLTANNTPDFTIAPPSGGTVTLQATTFKSSDGTSGATAGPFTTIASITVKNGLVTTLTGS